MPGRHIDATMDGAALPSGIIIREVHEDAPTLEILNGERPGRAGQLVLGRKRQSLKVTLECLITEIHNLQTRAQKAQDLAQWANGSVLTLTNHNNQQLNGHLTAVPTLGEVRDYNSPLRVEFTADQIPYWEDRTATTETVQALTTSSGSLTVPGTAPTPVIVTVKPTGSTMTDFTLTLGGKTITMTGMSVSSSQTLYFDRNTRDDLQIRRVSVSYMSKRTPESDDDLVVDPGTVAYEYTANTPVNVTFSFRGRWL